MKRKVLFVLLTLALAALPLFGACTSPAPEKVDLTYNVDGSVTQASFYEGTVPQETTKDQRTGGRNCLSQGEVTLSGTKSEGGPFPP